MYSATFELEGVVSDLCLTYRTAFGFDIYTSMAYSEQYMVIFGTSIFTEQILALLDDESYAQPQYQFIHQPGKGNLIQETGGLRKIRWTGIGIGKKGGSRAIYYWLQDAEQIYMLFAYPKNKQTDLTNEQKQLLASVVKAEIGR